MGLGFGVYMGFRVWGLGFGSGFGVAVPQNLRSRSAAARNVLLVV